MMTLENLPDGKIQLNVYTEDGLIHHIFDNIQELEKYVEKCLGGKNG